VFLFFENGNIMEPRFFATAPGISRVPANPKIGFFDPDGVFPRETGGEPDWNKGDVTDNYPDTFVIEDKGGNRIIMDSTPGKEKIIIQNGGAKRAKQTYSSTGSSTCHTGTGTDEKFTGSQRTIVGGDSEFTVTGKSILSAESSNTSILGDKKEFIAGASDATVTGIENKTAGGMIWNIKGDSDMMTAGEASFVSDATTKIKSNTMNIKLEATLMNIKMEALIGGVDSMSLRASTLAFLDASYKGLILTSLGGGVLTMVDGIITLVGSKVLTWISGPIIIIG